MKRLQMEGEGQTSRFLGSSETNKVNEGGEGGDEEKKTPSWHGAVGQKTSNGARGPGRSCDIKGEGHVPGSKR